MNAGPSQSAVLAQALATYENGNLQTAKAGAQSITDATMKPAANRLLADIDRYNGYVSSGQRHEQAREYAEAERAYRSALESKWACGRRRPHVGKSQRMHQLASGSNVLRSGIRSRTESS